MRFTGLSWQHSKCNITVLTLEAGSVGVWMGWNHMGW